MPTPPRQRARRRTLLAVSTVVVAIVVPLLANTNQQSEPVAEALTGGQLVQVTESAERTSLPDTPRRPRVFLAYTGTQGLLGNTDAQWAYVSGNLDGLWGNTVRVGVDQAIALTRKVETRTLIVERDIAPGGACQPLLGPNIGFFETVEARASDITFDREAAALYAGANPNCWGAGGGIAAAERLYAAAGYPEVYAVYQPQNLSGSLNAGAFPTIAPGSSGDVAYRTGGGVVVECPLDACTDPTFGAPFWTALGEARARGVPFVWYTANSRLYGLTRGWLGRVATTYQAAAAFGLWRPQDAIVIVPNDAAGSYPMLPETTPAGDSADTTTGIVNWLLRQTPITTLCTSRSTC